VSLTGAGASAGPSALSTMTAGAMGCASMLLYSLLHLVGVKAVNPKYETLGQFSVSLDDIKRFRSVLLRYGVTMSMTQMSPPSSRHGK
jgi:hypothetical protein